MELDHASIRTSEEVRYKMARQPPELAERQRALGRYLATLREAAGLYQTDIARVVPCRRTTVTHAETGSQLPDADFWETADSVVGAQGALIAQYDALIQARETHKADQRAARRARANTELAKLASSNERTAFSVTSNGRQLAVWQDLSLRDGDEHEALELARRVAASDVSTETLNRLEDIVDDLAIKYPKTQPRELLGSVRRHIA
ncbi:MAG: helix-turn-helix domain-containing protein, partial [Pseudonocardiaceae bacterium]